LLIDSKPSKGLRKFLTKHCDGETLAVADSKLGNAIKEKLVSMGPQLFNSIEMISTTVSLTIFGVVALQKIDCLHNSAVMELMRGLRSQLTELMSGLAEHDLGPMSLGLSHSLSRYKLKFSPEKVSLQLLSL
jgi:nucleolar protein 58